MSLSASCPKIAISCVAASPAPAFWLDQDGWLALALYWLAAEEDWNALRA